MNFVELQDEDPRITFRKGIYVVGEYLEANCSSSPAYPAPHITWLINGKEVNTMFILLIIPYLMRNINILVHYPTRRVKNSSLLSSCCAYATNLTSVGMTHSARVAYTIFPNELFSV